MIFQNLQGQTFDDKVAIVCVGYNRIKSIRRLLTSLLQAKYPSNDIPLIISIDCSGDTNLYDYVNDYDWPYGPKYVNIQNERLGLKNHIYQCGDLTQFFRAIILLEDDLFVSPYFYIFTLNVLDRYSEDKRIAQISLYKNEQNGYVGLPFNNQQNGFDIFLMQDVSTWGECWTKSMWNEFKIWRDTHSEEYIMNVDMPERIKGWSRAWSKYYNAYVVDMNKYIIYPNVSLTTNFSDAGEHGGDNNSIVQVNLLQGEFDYRLGKFDNLVKYDIYFNNEMLYKWLNISKENLCLDVYGNHKNNHNCRYILSTRLYPFKVVRSFALNMRPIELNVKYAIPGEGLFLYDTSVYIKKNSSGYNSFVGPYFLRGFNIRLLIKYIFAFGKNFIKRKLC